MWIFFVCPGTDRDNGCDLVHCYGSIGDDLLPKAMSFWSAMKKVRLREGLSTAVTFQLATIRTLRIPGRPRVVGFCDSGI
jgi:hypothetical protein